MKYYLLSIAIVLLLCNCQNKTTNQPSNQNITALTGATVYIGDGTTLSNATVLIEDGKIKEIGQNITIPDNAEKLDLDGKFITPGLVDAHVHFFQTAFFDSRPDALNLRDSLPYEDVYEYQMNHPERYYQSYLRSGITAVYDVGDFSAAFEFLDDAESNPYAVHVATSGPLLTPVPEQTIAGFNVATDTVMIHLNSADVARKHILEVNEKGATGIKIWLIDPDNPEFMDGLATAAKVADSVGNGLIVHATTLKQAKTALKFKPRLLVHSVEDTLVDEEFIQLAKANSTYYNPTLVVGRGYYHTYNAVMGENFKMEDPNEVIDQKTRTMLTTASKYQGMITDTLQMSQRLNRMDEGLKTEQTTMRENLKRVYEAGIKIVVGTDAGNPGTLHGISIYDEMEAMQAAGLKPEDIIVMATKNGAEIMQMASKFGTLEKGNVADLIILSQDPGEDISNFRSITHTMRMGELLDVTEKFNN